MGGGGGRGGGGRCRGRGRSRGRGVRGHHLIPHLHHDHLDVGIRGGISFLKTVNHTLVQ